MPTGYTAGVGDGTITTLNEFALLCARAFGACVSMRDDPLDAPIPEYFKPSTGYYDGLIDAAKSDLIELTELSDDECETRAAAEYEELLSDHNRYEAERFAENERYRDMIRRVEEWDTKADGIKNFMIDQLRISITDYQSSLPAKMSGSEWRQFKLEKAQRDLDYGTKHRNEEIARTAERNRWIRDLRESLKGDE